MSAPLTPFPRLKTLLTFFGLTLVIPTLARLALIWTRKEDCVGGEASLDRMLWVGLRMDAVVGGALTVVVALVSLILPSREALWRGIAWVWAGILALVAGAEMAGWFFFEYYDARPNYLVLEHGADPEVMKVMVGAYPVGRIILSMLACAWIFHRFLRPSRPMASTTWKDRAGVCVLLVVALLCARGTLDHRPLNPSFAAFSPNRLANEIAGNGVFNVAYEWMQMSGENYGSVSELTEGMSAEEALALARGHLTGSGHFLGDETPSVRVANPLLRSVEGETRRPLNVVVVVMESFTARLGGSWGGELALTPECDTWAARGLRLKNCIATGERTVQGLEAVLCSFPPLPGVSVIRRPQARDGGFATLGSMLKERGYSTAFYYGGQGIFDHMKGFFIANGFDRFVEEDDFTEVTYKGGWGVCDEDVFLQADRDFELQHREGKPFCAAILTVSLHSPWEFPAGKAPLTPPGTPVPPGFDPPELDNFLYADWAVGRFLETASRKDYFKDTVFVFVGDHGVHLRGRDLVPLPEYRVVSFILAPGIPALAGRTVDRPVSQLDLAPTVLGLLGGSWNTPFFGRDILAPSSEAAPPFAVSIYKKRRYGVLEGGRFLVRSESGDTLCRVGEGLALTPDTMDEAGAASLRRGLGVVRSAEELLMTRRYKVE